MLIKIKEETYVHAITVILHNEGVIIGLLIFGFIGIVCIVIGFLYSTYFSYPSIQRDCSSFYTGKPLGSPKRKRKFSGYQYHQKSQLHHNNYREENSRSYHNPHNYRHQDIIPDSSKKETLENVRRTVLSIERTNSSEHQDMIETENDKKRKEYCKF
jgi:hypothetical protein